MALFPAEFSNKAFKYIDKLDKLMKERIKEKVEKLEQDPFPHEVERVEDFEGEKVFRVRVGNQRILYILTSPFGHSSHKHFHLLCFDI